MMEMPILSQQEILKKDTAESKPTRIRQDNFLLTKRMLKMTIRRIILRKKVSQGMFPIAALPMKRK